MLNSPLPQGTYGQSVTDLAKRYHAVTALYAMCPWVDDAMDRICEAAEIVEHEIFNTASADFSEIAIKLRILADKADDTSSLHDMQGRVRDIAGEWDRLLGVGQAAVHKLDAFLKAA
ncbi:hypothetical protein [Aminobacter sp. AP02]|uniref:hypothetical protein n=1 Tax=Aminobacter sp. AP02 TaxID=2135737 RepID=UPI000D7B5B06|nr:hypothetical protein [Aminobacter sp. AP02]PWK65899.1 hypothetical protein C8K44_115114 [Aminobacter sp. AP02]